MARGDISNSVLGRFLTLEMLGMVVLIGVSWGALTTRVNSLDSQIEDAKETTAHEVAEAKKVTDNLSSEVNQINRKVDVLSSNQEHFKDQINRVDDRLEKIQDLLEAKQ